MSITNFSAARRAGFKITNRGIKKTAVIDMTKVATRTLFMAFNPASGHIAGGAAEATDGIFAAVTLVDASTSNIYITSKLPEEFIVADVILTWYWKSATASGDAKFTARLCAKADSEDIAETDNQTVTTTVNATANKLNKSQVTFDSSKFALDDWIGVMISRDPADVADTLGADLNVVGFVIEFTGRG